MSRIIAFGLSISISMSMASLGSAFSLHATQQNSFWVEVCGSGLFINLAIDGGKDDPKPAHKMQACHAICCKDEEDNGKG